MQPEDNLIAKQINSTFEHSLIQKVNIFSFNSAKFCNYI